MRKTANVLLTAAPWPLFNRPSLPLGALKAYLTKALPQVTVTANHFFLEVARAVGYGAYQAVSRRVWRAEAIYAALLYPERADQAEALYRSTLPRNDAASDHFSHLALTAEHESERWLSRIDWELVDLVGFSISSCQTTASLYLISRVNAIRPNLPIVVGGSSFSAQAARGLLKQFPQIDYVIIGEGERPLTELVRRMILAGNGNRPNTLPAGVCSAAQSDPDAVRFNQLQRLDALPTPDYDDYFDILDQLPVSERFFATLPVEASRGCWWQAKEKARRFKGCAFCNLNLQWQGYRTKTAQQVVREVNTLVRRHQVLSLAFADNALPPHGSAALADGLRSLEWDLSIFAELRATTPPEHIRKLAAAGLDTVQVGIESLSGRLLKKMNKGTRVIDNLFIMKVCELYGIAHSSNLILHFPSSDASDVHETLQTLDFVQWYRPLKTVGFWLGLGSPVYRLARDFHIRARFNHPNLKKLFPARVANGLRFMIQGYRGDRQQQRRLWQPVETRVREWSGNYARLQKQTGGSPALTARDGETFMIVKQYWPDRMPIKHRLTGVSAAIYRHLHHPGTLRQLAEAFPTHERGQIERFLHAMVVKRLMFKENDQYLSLAVPVREKGDAACRT
ncbi:conserved hypothetical protein [Desulfosarcina cetonica]|nr:conserved hypothetical protein [Desulfosarcina cetonica]